MDKEKAMLIYTGQKAISSFKKYPEVEEHFFAVHNFKPAFHVPLIDSGRSFYISEDDRFYFSPDWFSKKNYVIHDCKRITDVDIVDVDSGNASVAGALLGGVTGAVVGGTFKHATYAIKVSLNDPDDPVVFALLSIGQIKQNSQNYRDMIGRSAEIVSRLKSYIKTTVHVDQINTDDFLAKLEKIAALKQAGLLTDEEFLAAKAKLLS